MLLILQQSIQSYIYTGTYNISSIEDFTSANGKKIQTLNLLSDLDFKDQQYSRISIPQYFEGNNHTISNIYYSSASNQISLFTFLQQGNEQCHDVTIRNLHLLNITLVSTIKAITYQSEFSAGLFFARSNHPTIFKNISVTNSTFDLQGNTGFDMVGGLIGLNWGYPIRVQQVAMQLQMIQRKEIIESRNMTDENNQSVDNVVYNNYYGGLIGYNHGSLTIQNSDIKLIWNSNSTYYRNIVAGVVGMQKQKVDSNIVTIQFTVYAYQATGSFFSGYLGNGNDKVISLKNTDITMRGNNYRSVHSSVCNSNWTQLTIENLQTDVNMWNNSIDENYSSVNSVIPSRKDDDKIASCINCCTVDYNFEYVYSDLQYCHNDINTYLDENNQVSQGQKDCIPERINITCDVNAICQIRPFGASKLLTCECFQNFTKNIQQVCQGVFEEIEQAFSEITEDTMQSSLDPITISIASIVGVLCVASLVWMIWIIKNKTKFDGTKKQKPKTKKQPKKQKKDTNTEDDAKDMDYYDNNPNYNPRRQKRDVKNKYYDNNTTLKSKYVSKLKPVQM